MFAPLTAPLNGASATRRVLKIKLNLHRLLPYPYVDIPFSIAGVLIHSRETFSLFPAAARCKFVRKFAKERLVPTTLFRPNNSHVRASSNALSVRVNLEAHSLRNRVIRTDTHYVKHKRTPREVARGTRDFCEIDFAAVVGAFSPNSRGHR